MLEFTNDDGTWTSADNGFTWQLAVPSVEYLERQAEFGLLAMLTDDAPTIDDAPAASEQE